MKILNRVCAIFEISIAPFLALRYVIFYISCRETVAYRVSHAIISWIISYKKKILLCFDEDIFWLMLSTFQSDFFFFFLMKLHIFFRWTCSSFYDELVVLSYVGISRSITRPFSEIIRICTTQRTKKLFFLFEMVVLYTIGELVMERAKECIVSREKTKKSRKHVDEICDTLWQCIISFIRKIFLSQRIIWKVTAREQNSSN